MPDAPTITTLDELLAGANSSAVRLEPHDDARALIPHLGQLSLIEINFPKFRDGRGYSSARILREAGYAGTLRAVGDVLVDQLLFLRRAGFDSEAPDRPMDPKVAAATLARYSHVYQKATDPIPPAWAIRHED
ncbi:MAG: DUF934 domain-containing protein [Polymorphobacter sp.]|uniref:DUF934 domain-containing protein n=1 Tax=Polymorphobacter sp. TaxID=1909290 RepID=UPI003A83526D